MNKLFTPAVRIAFAFAGLTIILGTVVSTFNYERSAQAAYNAEINYQGKLTNGSNVAVADGDYNMEFKLYDAVSGGSLLWTETRTGANKVTVTNGVFSVMLGEVNPFGSLDFNQTLFLSVNIGGTGSPSWDGEMTPRKKIGTVPVAFLASNLKGTGLVDITNTSTQATFNYDGSNRATLGVASNGFTTLTAVGAGAGWNLTGGNVGIGTATTSAKLHVTATTEQLRVGYDAGNYASFTTSSGGDLTIAPSGSDLAITGNVDVSGTFTSGTADAFVVNSSGAVTAGTWTGTDIAILDGGTGASTSQAAINNLSQLTTEGDLVYRNATNTTRLARGTDGQCLKANATTILWGTCGGALTPWTSDIDADGFDLNDLSNLEFRETTGAPAGSVVAIYRDNTGDLNLNSLTAKTTNIQVNGTDEYNFSSTGLAFNSNNITGLGTGLTATAGLTITSTSADLTLATNTSGNITFAPASTGSVQFTSGVTTGTTTSSGLSLVANSLTSGTGVDISSSSVTSGTLLNLSSTGTAALTGNKAFSVSQSGANGTGGQTTYGLYSTNTRTGTSNNVAGYFSATGGSNNYAAIFENGKVGIGTTTPSARLDVSGTDIGGAYTNGFGQTWNLVQKVDNTITTDPATDLAVGLLSGISMNIASGTVSGTQAYGLTGAVATAATDGATYDSTSAFTGVVGASTLQGTGSVNMAVGGSFLVNRIGTGVVTNIRGINAAVQNFVGSGTIADVRGINIQQPASTAGSTMTNIYGLYLENQTPAAGTVTNTPYGIYQAGSANYNYFAGNTGIGTTAPTGGKLQVNTNDTTPSLLLVAADNQPYIMQATNSTFSSSPAFSYYIDNDGTFLQGTDQATDFQIYTDGYANPRLTIDSAGDVGIGTTAPDRPLEVNSATGLGLRLTYNDANGSAANFADLQVSSGGAFNILPSGFIANVGGGTTQTALRFLEPSGTGTDYAAIQANSNVTTSYTWTLPAADASGCIQSNGSGALSIAACGGGALTPWTSDIDADGFDLNDLSNLEFRETTGAPAGSVVAIYRDNTGDLNLNSLTAKTTNIQVNGTDEYNFSSTGLAFNSNNITGLGTGLTATAGLTITSTSADLTLATNTSGNINLNSTGGTIELQNATNITGALDVSTTLAVGTANAFQVAADGNLTSANAGTWTFSNDTNFALTGGVNGLSIDGTTFSVDGNSDRVGIGTAAPIVKFQVAGTALIQPDTTWSSGDSSVLLFSDDNSNRIEAYYTPAANSGSLNLRGYSGVDLTTNLGVVLHSTQNAMTNIGSNNDADALLEINGNRSVSAWGLNGIQLQASTSTFTDSSTATSGTATNAVFNSFAAPTLAATNTTVTTTNAATVYIANAPTAGTNQTITNAYSLWVDAGTARFDGSVGIGVTAPGSLLHVQQSADSTNTSSPVALDINSIGGAGELTASSGNQIFARIAPVVNQTSTASYRALDVNVTETAVTTANGLNRLADFRVSDSSKLAIANDGTLTLQNASSLVSPYASIGAFQNHLVRSEEFDNASWTKTNVSAPTANTQVGPDGSTTAESLATSSSGGDVCQLTSTAPGSNTFTFSFWARSTSGTQNFDMRVDAGATSCATANSTTGTAVTHTATTSWQRFSVTQTFSGASNFVKVRIFPGGTGGSGTIYGAKAQLEMSSTANAYALTTGGALTNTNRGESIVSNFATASGFTYGGRHITNLEGSIAASSTTVGQLIRVNDNATGTDDTATVRALEVQSYSGSNINGVNTAIAGFGYTFGIHGVTTAQANESAQPAAVFADLDNGSAPTQGNAIRAYSNNLTSADLVSFYHETTAFTGNGLEMNFGNSAGSFSGNFISLQKGGTQSFHVDDDGSTFVSFTGTGTAHAVCHATNGNTNDDELVDCTSGPSADYAEMYPVDSGIEAGELVAVGTEMVNTYDALASGDGVNWNDVKGQITRLTRSTSSYQKNLVGIVSDNYADFSSTGYNIKPEDNPTSVALKGRVLVKVTDENGPIKAGDYITSSNEIAGYGTKATRSGQVVGQALADIDFSTSSTGEVMVFVQTGYQSIGNTIVLDAPSTNGINLQSGNNSPITNTASTFVIQQQTLGEQDTEANILQLQTGDANRFMVSSTGSTSILSNLNCEADADSCPSVLRVTQADTELMNIDARGTLTLAGTIVIKDDTFAGSVATDEDGLAEITFSYHLGTGKPVVQLTAEAQIPVFAQIVEFKQDDNGNYTGFVMKTFDLISGPIQAIVHYNVVGKQAGYITLGEAVVSDEELEFYSSDDSSDSGVGLIIDGGEVVGNQNDQNEGNSSGDNSGYNGSVSGDFTPNNPDDTITTDDGSGSEPLSE